jgi:PAS domain S-box-containing protein
MKTGKPYELDLEIANPKSSTRWINARSETIYDSKRKIIGLRGTALDITARKLAEEKLKQSENDLHLFIDYTYDWEYLIDKNGFISYSSPSCKRVTGYSAKDFINKKLLIKKIIHSDDLKICINHFKESHDKEKQKSSHIDFRIINKKGHIVYISHVCTPVFDEKHNFIGRRVSNRDITARIKAEQAEFQIKKRDEYILNSIGDAVFACDNSGKILIFNKMAEQITGYAGNEALGFHYTKVVDFGSFLENKKYKDFIRDIINVKINEKIKVYNPLIIIKKDGSRVPVVDSASPIKNMEGNVIGCVVVFHDVTEENELNQAKNDFLALTSHQLRTPLSATKWVLESMIKDEKTFTPKQQKRFNDLIISNERLINLVNRLLDVNRIESGKLIVNKKLTDLKEIVNNLASSFKILADKKGKVINVIFPLDIKKIFCDPVLIHEAVENFLSNAINFAADESKDIDIEINEREKDYVVSVHNDGSIDPSSIKKINNFQKFTRGVSAPQIEPSGSGLGLYITKKVIEASGGIVWFESNAKTGTTFYLTIIKK